MRFQNVEDYKNQRNKLINEVEKLMAEDKHTEAAVKMTEIEQMDNDWENDKVEMANKATLAGRFGNIKGLKIGEGEKMNNGLDGALTETSMRDELAYRKAFMNYVTKGEKMPNDFQNSNQNTKTTDIGALIPDTVLQKIIEKMEVSGQILSKVTRTAFKGGVTIPTSTVKPVATWVAEGATSNKQKKSTGTITFAYHKLRCAVSVSLEVDTMALEVFERTIINNIAEAMVKALEKAILLGSGSGQPKGFLTEEVVEGQNIDIASSADLTIDTLEAAEDAIPLAYESGAVWVMNKKTYLKAKNLKDTEGQYIFKENRGVDGQVVRMIRERQVILTDDMPKLEATVGEDTIVAAIVRLEDYILNTNYSMGIREYYDEDTEDKIKKSVMLCDGKIIDKNSLVTVTKKNA